MLQHYKGSLKEKRRLRRHKRVRGKISGTAERPRVCVTRSQASMFVQVIDDVARKTIVGVHSKKIAKGLTKTQAAEKLGEDLGADLKAKGITTIVFDRGGYAYHGRVAALADGLRQSGLQF